MVNSEGFLQILKIIGIVYFQLVHYCSKLMINTYQFGVSTRRKEISEKALFQKRFVLLTGVSETVG